MFKILTNLTKAAICVAATPIAAIADAVTLPSSAYDNRHPFERTGELLKTTGELFKDAIKPD